MIETLITQSSSAFDGATRHNERTNGGWMGSPAGGGPRGANDCCARGSSVCRIDADATRLRPALRHGTVYDRRDNYTWSMTGSVVTPAEARRLTRRRRFAFFAAVVFLLLRMVQMVDPVQKLVLRAGLKWNSELNCGILS